MLSLHYPLDRWHHTGSAAVAAVGSRYDHVVEVSELLRDEKTLATRRPSRRRVPAVVPSPTKQRPGKEGKDRAFAPHVVQRANDRGGCVQREGVKSDEKGSEARKSKHR